MSFHTTRWSLVFRAAVPGESGRLAIAELCQAYWPPVHAFYRRACKDPEEALDLTQGLFARLLEREDFAAAAPTRGRFRSWLCACARHHLSDVRSALTAKKRSGGATAATGFAALQQLEPIDPGATPEQAFEQSWVRALLDRAFSRLSDENEQRGRGRVFQMARPHLDGDDGSETMRHTAEQLGMSEGAFKVAVHRLRDRLRELVVDEVRQTLDDPGEAPAEVKFLLGCLARKKS
ncbi:MAG: sigma-70 family RNA polymerase sigma factor [Planctomycetota bacterium]